MPIYFLSKGREISRDFVSHVKHFYNQKVAQNHLICHTHSWNFSVSTVRFKTLKKITVNTSYSLSSYSSLFHQLKVFMHSKHAYVNKSTNISLTILTTLIIIYHPHHHRCHHPCKRAVMCQNRIVIDPILFLFWSHYGMFVIHANRKKNIATNIPKYPWGVHTSYRSHRLPAYVETRLHFSG